MKLYHDLIMDHYHHPRHHGVIKNPDFMVRNFNPSCGDSMVISGRIKHGHLVEVAFEGSGCVISQATASMLLDNLIQKKVEEVIKVSPDDLQQLIGIKLGPVRLKYALMSLVALQSGIREFQQKENKKDQENNRA